MNGLVAFAKNIKARLADTSREPHWTTDEAQQYMAAIADRRARFAPLAMRLCTEVIRPRLEMVAGYFSNAQMADRQPDGRCACWFGYCERFPASTRVAFSVEHDLRLENVIVHYEASMMPLFVRLRASDDGIWPLDAVNDDAVNDDAVAAWVEARLLDFLDAYLQIDRGGGDFADEPVTDPVCGMRIARSAAAASGSFRGHPYFFCSAQCQKQFSAEPQRYVAVESL